MSFIDCMPTRRSTRRRVRCVLRTVLTSLLAATAAGCSWGDREETPPDTVARISLIAMDDVNPNVAGAPSPIVVVFYELAEPQAFDGAEFNQLFYDDGSSLGSDVKARLELRVEPGQIIRMNRVLDPETRYLGFVAGYREIEDAQWRIVADVAPATTRSHTLVVGARSLSLPEVVPNRIPDSARGHQPTGMFGGLADAVKGLVAAALPGS